MKDQNISGSNTGDFKVKTSRFEIILLYLYEVFNSICFDSFDYYEFSKFTFFSLMIMLENCFTYTCLLFIYYTGAQVNISKI
jgi:hypothetical protein